MPEYENAKIYKIWSPHTELIYIGSTTQALSNRLACHRSYYKKYLKTNKNYISSFEIIQYGDAKIELFENCPCNNKEELNKREGEIIRRLNCVNKNIAGRTQQEWVNEHKNYKRQYYKNYYESVKEKRQQKVECRVCKCMIRMDNLKRHTKTKKHINKISFYII